MSEIKSTQNLNSNNIDLKQFKVGTVKSNVKGNTKQSIFNALDTNKDGKLDKSEVKGIVKGKSKNTKGQLVEQEYIKVKDLENGRSLVVGKNGKSYVMSHDGVILKSAYVKQNKTGQNSATPKSVVNLLNKQYKNASQSFEKQLAEDGWAGDLADGISVLWGSKNRASEVRKDLDIHKKNLAQLSKAAQQGEAQFQAKFKQIFGLSYNKTAVENYMKKPTEANYKKAFGDKQNIQKRVNEYNESQQTGASVVKTGATVAAGVAIGVATGGTGLVAMGTAAAATAAASTAINASDRISSDVGLKDGEMKEIVKNATFDGASVLAGGVVGKVAGTVIKGSTKTAAIARAAVSTTGDVATGAAQEYLETGKVTASGTAINATIGSVGVLQASGILKKAKGTIKRAFSKKTTNVVSNNITHNTSSSVTSSVNQNFDNGGNLIAGASFGDSGKSQGLFGKFKAKFGLTSKIDHSTKENLKKNYMDDLVQTVERNDNFVLSKRVSDAVNGKPLVKDLGNNVNIKDINNYVANGDICSVGVGKNGKLYINDNGTPIELKISREKLEELFPPLETSTFSQPGGTHVCTIQSKINTMLDTPKGRVNLYTMLEQQGDDIIVHLRGDRAPVVFKNGKPANINLRDHNANLFNGNAPGVEMIQQAVLVDRIRMAENVSDAVDISDFSLSKLIKKAGQDAPDSSASIPLLGKKGKIDMFPKAITKTLEEDYIPGEDMMTALWDGHARSIVNYDKTNKIITYHDPMGAGYDVQESLETFLSHNPSINLNKASSVVNSPNVNSSSSSSVDVVTHKPIAKDGNVGDSNNITNQRNSLNKPISSNTILTKDWHTIMNTTDGKPIQACITSDGNVNILKNGKVINVEKPDNGSYVPILETSTDNFIIIQADHNGRLSVQISDVPEIDVSEMKYSPTNNSSIRENSRNRTETSNSPEVSNILSLGTMLNNKWTKVATNADGKSIHACITPDGNVKILNNSKISNVTRPNNNSYTSVQEKSTGNYLLIMADNDGNISVQVSDVPEPRTNSIKSSQDVNVRNLDNTQEGRQSAHTSQVEKKVNSATQSKLPIPPGFREHGQILGRRAIIGPDNVVMYESKGVWKKIN